MKHHFPDLHIHPIADRWTEKHPMAFAVVITCLVGAIVAAFLTMFESYQTTGIWSLTGR